MKSLAHDAHLSVPLFWRDADCLSESAGLDAAATLLQCTSLDAGKIGRRVGYHDIFHFSKLFKQHFAVTPSGFGASSKLASYQH
ncbi:MAG TPA: helix-turn-helix domain-containing protein [Abditibacteriaceae bacterium]|jgi:AraC-like DNA-binding protein